MYPAWCSINPYLPRFTTRSYDLMSKLQLGVRYSIGRNAGLAHLPGAASVQHTQHAAPPMLSLRGGDFTEKAKVFFPSSGRCVGGDGPCGWLVASHVLHAAGHSC